LRHLAFALAACTTLVAAPALAQSEAQSAPLDRNALSTIICQEYGVTGSRIGKRMVCLTNLQWQEVHRLARDGYMLEVKKSFTMGHNI